MPITGAKLLDAGRQREGFCDDAFLLNCNLMHYATEGVLNPLPP